MLFRSFLPARVVHGRFMPDQRAGFNRGDIRRNPKCLDSYCPGLLPCSFPPLQRQPASMLPKSACLPNRPRCRRQATFWHAAVAGPMMVQAMMLATTRADVAGAAEQTTVRTTLEVIFAYRARLADRRAWPLAVWSTKFAEDVWSGLMQAVQSCIRSPALRGVRLAGAPDSIAERCQSG